MPLFLPPFRGPTFPLNLNVNPNNIGAVVGTPGTLPTGWSVPTTDGLTTNVSAIGVDSTTGVSIPYVDVEVTGTSTGTSYTINLTSSTKTPGGAGSSYLQQTWIALTAGALTNITTVQLILQYYTGAGAFVGNTSGSAFTPNSTLTLRSAGPGTMSVGASNLVASLHLVTGSSAAIEATFRIAGVMLYPGRSVQAWPGDGAILVRRRKPVGPNFQLPILPLPVRDTAPGSTDTTLTPGAGSIVFTGAVPTVDTNLLPGSGSIVFTGAIPVYSDVFTPGAGSVVFTGLAPPVALGAAPGAGSVVFTGLAPSPNEALLPGAGSVVFTGLAPSADEQVLPGAGSGVFTGFAPLVDLGALPLVTLRSPRRHPGRGPRPLIPPPVRDLSGNVAAYPDAGTATFTGLVPTVDTAILPGAGSVVFTGLAPSANEALLPGVGSVVFTGATPTADEALLPGAGSVIFTGLGPRVDETVLPDIGAVVFTGAVPTITNNAGGDTTVVPGTGSVVFTGLAPPVDFGAAPGVGSVVFTGLSPSADEALLPDVGAVVFTGAAPTVNNAAGNDTTVVPDPGSVVFTGLVPTITGAGAPTNITADVGNLAFAGWPPDLALMFAPGKGGPDEDYRQQALDLDRRRRDEDDIMALLLTLP